MGKQIDSNPNETMDALSRYSWPRNIRKLQNLMERAALLSTGPSLRVPLAQILNDPACSGALRALRESNWVVGGTRGAVARLGLKRTSSAYKMGKLGISRPPLLIRRGFPAKPITHSPLIPISALQENQRFSARVSE
jgi:formate hydrogenlyase transcriptional activator